MSTYVKPAALLLLLLNLVTGAAYPALVTVLAQALFNHQANGSLLQDQQGQAIGSELIGQSFSGPKYFWGRPSATGPYAYNAVASSGSNIGPTNPALTDAVSLRIQTLKDADPSNQLPVPVDLVTASGSGLDPHISVAGANYQITRVAHARGVEPEKLRDLVKQQVEGRQWGLFGEPRVNVLRLNLALDALR
jgi:potassium-transporting ATPase KdpC subunit